VAATAVSRSGGLLGVQRVTNGVQYDGSVCGVDASVLDKQFVYWPSPLDMPRLQVCVAACPDKDSVGQQLVVPPTNGHAFALYDTVQTFHYCVPVPGSPGADAVLDDLQNSAFSHVVTDLGRAWPVLLGSAFVALFAGYAYLLMLRYTAGAMVWAVIWLIILGLGAAGYLLFSHSQGMTDGSSGKDAQKWVAVGLWAADVIFMLIVCGLRKSIKVAIAVLKEATKAVRDVKSMMLVPPVKFLILMLVFAYWIGVSVYMVAAGEGGPGQPYTATSVTGGTVSIPTQTLKWGSDMGEMFAFHFFGLLWISAFVVAVGDLILAHSTAQWYFAVSRDGKRSIESPVSSAIGATLRFHLGTAAFGSLVLAVISFIKWFMRYVHKQLHGKEAASGPLRVLLCACMCCIQCFEKCIKFLNRQVFVQTAIFGTSFCASSGNAFSLVARNAGRVASLSAISGIFLTLGTLMVTAVTAVAAYLFTEAFYSGADGVSSPVMPTVVAGIIGYVVGAVMTQVFDVSISTVLHCFIADVDAHSEKGGPARAEFASAELARVASK